jgi:hypothetical protein
MYLIVKGNRKLKATDFIVLWFIFAIFAPVVIPLLIGVGLYFVWLGLWKFAVWWIENA